MSIKNLPKEFDRFFFGEAGGVPEGFVDIFRFKVGVGFADGYLCFAGRQKS